jgi:hypothetical protein
VHHLSAGIQAFQGAQSECFRCRSYASFAQFEVQSILQQEKADPRGLSESQFTRNMLMRLKRQDPDEKVRQIYKAFDVVGKGFLTVDDLKTVFKEVKGAFASILCSGSSASPCCSAPLLVLVLIAALLLSASAGRHDRPDFRRS